MKKRFVGLLVMMISLCFGQIGNATETDVIISLQLNNPIMQVNGVETEIDEGRSTSPVVLNGRTLVPIRAIVEEFGGNVGWNGQKQAVTLTLNNDVIVLTIDSSTALFNDDVYTLDVPPTSINGRTMLPIRFIAESFNLGVAWDKNTQTVSIVRNILEDYEYHRLLDIIPQYSGSAYAEINNNIPFFKDYEVINGSFEYYSKLDELGRCDVCMASVGNDLMPMGEREDISSVIPSGWLNKSYDVVSGGCLYNRCHLIGYQLTGENANERNLITGTRHMNVEGMLPFENMVYNYIEESGNNVMYRATPLFKDNNLVADGVLLEAYSVEDNGRGLSFCVYCYNVQPQIEINYLTGDSSLSKVGLENDSSEINGIFRTPKGKRYHYDAQCGGKNSFPITLDEAKAAGLTPCTKCAQ